MEVYLSQLKASLGEREQTDFIHAVIGNEACDLDSAASAIIYAYYLHSKNADQNTVIIPVLNIAASQFRLRTETTYFFNKLNIPSNCLLFKDNVEFGRWQSEDRLKLTLVDHNVLTGTDVQYEDCVVQVIDHHVLERKSDDRVDVKLDFVGSCCTLVAEELLNDPDFKLDDTVAELLYGTILVDTINRSPEAGKITPRDKAVLSQLECIIPNVKGDNLFEDIQAAKFDISGLLNMEILEKDLKMVNGTAMTISMCSVTMEMTELLNRENFKKDLDDFCEKQSCDVVVIMTLVNNDEGKPERQIAVYSKNRIFRDQISDTMDNSEDIDLGLEPLYPPFDDISVFTQNNVQASRKKVMPILKSFLHGDITPDVSSKDFVTQHSVAMATEGFSHLEVGESETVPEETETENRVKFTIESLERSSTDEEIVPVESFGESYKNYDSVDLDSTGSIGVKNTVHVQQIPHDFDLSIKGGTADSNKTSGKTQNPFGDLPSSDFNSALLSSAHSSNIFDLGISDSELVDPFSSVEDSANPDSVVNSPKTNILGKSSENEAKSLDISEDVEPHVNELSELEENSENQIISCDTGNPIVKEASVTEDDEIYAQNGNPFLSDDSERSEQVVNFQLSEYGEDGNAADDFFNTNDNNANKFGAVNFLDVNTLRIDHPPARKSASLIVECDDKSQADDLAELEESELFDKMNTPGHSGENSPFAMSGLNSPFINSGTGTPFELPSNYHSRTTSESGFPDIAPPPNSLMDTGFSEDDTDRRLPSFNSAEMVDRIQQKKASLGGGQGLFDLDEKAEESSTPYTPQNSYREEGLFMRDNSLPNLMDSDFVEKVQQKRNSLSANLFSDTNEKTEVKLNSTNPFGDFTDATSVSNAPSSNPFFQSNDQSLEFDPFGPIGTSADEGSEVVQGSATNQDFMGNLSEFKPTGEVTSTNEDILDIFGDSSTNKTETLVENQTSSQDWFGFSSFDGPAESKPDQTLNPFLAEFENNAQTEQDSDDKNIDTRTNMSIETSEFIDQPVETNEINDQSVESRENGDQSVDTNEIIDQATLKALNDSANLEAADTVSEALAREIIHNAIETFPDLSNPLLATEMMQRNDADWTEQGSGDSGIGSTGSPQQGPKGGARKLNHDYSVETEYLPSMDPLHGSLNITSTSDTRSIETDADKEVVESESFRKVSSEGATLVSEQALKLAKSAKMEHITEQGDNIPDKIRDMIINDNIQTTLTSEQLEVTNDSINVADDLLGTDNIQSNLASEQVEVTTDTNIDSDDIFGTDIQSTLTSEQLEVTNDSINIADDLFGTNNIQSTLKSEQPEVTKDASNDISGDIFGTDNFQSTLTSEQQEVTNDSINVADDLLGTDIIQSTLNSEQAEVTKDASNDIFDDIFGTDNFQSTLTSEQAEVTKDTNIVTDDVCEADTQTSEQLEGSKDANNVLDDIFGTDNIIQTTSTSDQPDSNAISAEQFGQTDGQLQTSLELSAAQSDDLLGGTDTAEGNLKEIIDQDIGTMDLAGLSELDDALTPVSKTNEVSSYSENLTDVIETVKEGILKDNIEASAVDMNLGNSNNNLVGVFDDQFPFDNEKSETLDLEGNVVSSSQVEMLASQEKDKVENEGSLLDFTYFEDTGNKSDNIESKAPQEESDFFNSLAERSEIKEESVNNSEPFDSSNVDVFKGLDHITSEKNHKNESEMLKDQTLEDVGANATNDENIEELDEEYIEEADTNLDEDFEEGIVNKGFVFDSTSLSDVNIEKDSESMIEEESGRNSADEHVGNESEKDVDESTVDDLENKEPDSPEMKKSDSDNSVSSDASSSFPTTSESESELVTVRENVNVMTDYSEIFREDSSFNQQEGGQVTLSGAATELENKGPDEYQEITEEKNESENVDLGLSEQIISDKQDEHVDSEINEKESKTWVEDKERDSTEEFGADKDDESSKSTKDDNNLIKVNEGMTDSAVTIESVSSVETPLEEHVSGFYEVNPEIICENTAENLLSSSAYATNLGENETGYYEVNAEQDTMITSSLTTESMSSVDTPENEKNVTGFYEMNASLLEQAIEKDDNHFLNIDDAYSDASASPLETPETEEMKGFYDINAEKLEKAIERIDSLDVNNSLMVDSTYSDDSSVSPMETPDIESVSGFYQMNESVESSNVFSDPNVVEDKETEIAPLGPDDAPEINIELVGSPNYSSKDSFDSETEPDFELSDNKSMEEERKVNEETKPEDTLEDEKNLFGQDFIENDDIQKTIHEKESKACGGDEEQARQSGEFDTAPEIMVEMTTSTDSVESHDSAEEGFYEMNAEIQGTMLQNIAIGNAFSPIESPSEEVFNLDYEINPMVPDVNDMSSSQTSDDISMKADHKPFVRFVDNEKEIDAKVEEIADVLVESALSEAIGSLQEQIFKDTAENESDDKDELAEDMIVVDKPEDNEKFVKVADDLVNEAIASAIEVVQEIRLSEEEQFITSEIASAMKESYDSSDSEGSSTTTEGSYRIVNSVDFSPAATPDREEVNSPELVIDKDHLMQDDIFEENDLITTEDLDNIIDNERTDKELLTDINEKEDSVNENEMTAEIDTSNAMSQYFNDENGNITLETTDPSSQSAVEPETAEHEPLNECDLTSSSIVGNDMTKKLGRQETLIPDIVISKEDTPPGSDDSESELVNKTDIKPETESEITEVQEELIENVSVSNVEASAHVMDSNESTKYGMQEEELIDNTNDLENIESMSQTSPDKTDNMNILDDNEVDEFKSEIESRQQTSSEEKDEIAGISCQVLVSETVEKSENANLEGVQEVAEKGIVEDKAYFDESNVEKELQIVESEIIKHDTSLAESEVGVVNDTQEIVSSDEVLDKPEQLKALETCAVENGTSSELNNEQEFVSEIVDEKVELEKVENENKIVSEHSSEQTIENGEFTGESVNEKCENVEMQKIEKDTDKQEGVTYHNIKDLESEKEEKKGAKAKKGSAEYVTRKEIFYTSAGRMSISIDSVLDPPSDTDQCYTGGQDIIHEETHEGMQVSCILARTGSAIMQADQVLTKLSEATIAQQNDNARNVRASFIDIVSDDDTISNHSQPVDDDDDDATSEKHVVIEKVQPEKPKPSHEKMKMDDTQEWHEDPIPGMGVTAHDSSTDESDTESDSEYTKPARPDSLLNGARRKKKIAANNFLSPDSTDDLVEGVDDIPTPDDLETPSDIEGELEWEDDTPITPTSDTKKFVEYRDDEAEREKYENTKFRKVEIAGKDYRVDMKVIEPYKKVLSHGGYYGDGLNAIILFCGCYLPDRGRRDYQYVMDNLFLYVISTLELLVAEDYMIVYFHGATPRRQMPSFGWLKRCYQMIDRRLRKNLKALLMVHPTLWLKTVVMMTKPFISSKFSSKLRFVKTLQELGKIVPMEYIYVPEPVSHTEIMLQADPDYLEKWEKEQEKKGLTPTKQSKFSFFRRKKNSSSSS